MRVPVRVEYDDSVRGLQVETQSSGSGTQQKDEEVTSRLVKLLQQISSVFSLGGSVEPQVREASPAQVVFHNRHQLCHLTKQQYSVICLLQLR